MSLNVTIVGGERVQAKLAAMGRSLRELAPAFNDIGSFLENYYGNEVFMSQGGIWGDQWAPLLPATITGKIRGGGTVGASPAAPLIRTGTMQRGFKHEGGNDYVRVYNDTEYFKFHQLGTTNIPQRLMISINSGIKNRISQQIRQAVADKIGEV